MTTPSTRSVKIVPWARLLRSRAGWKKQGLVVVWTNGCFDLIHVGHIRSLLASKTAGDLLIVGVNSDTSVRTLKGSSRPIVPLEERMEILAALECVDFVVSFDDLTPERLLSELRPDIHCKGSDYAPPNGKPIPEAPIVYGYGGKIIYIPLESTTSTSSRIKSIQARG